jgi:hypothetical protein
MGGNSHVPMTKRGLVMHWDAVTIGSIASVVVAIVIFVFLAYKVTALIKSDAEKHKQQK